jgi:pimeloyl-ACP methyl ester carboxylesterase
MRKSLEYKGGRIAWYESGRGEALVLLHGYLETSEIWSDFAGILSDKYRVIAMDLPGHGLSDIYGECHTMEFMAGVVKELLDHLGIKKTFLVGHSLGGYVALAFVELYSEYLTGYCLFHSHPFADTPEALEKREREIRIVKAGKKDIMYPDNVTMMYASPNLERFSGAIERSKGIASGISGDGIIAVLRGMMARPSRLKVMEEGRVSCLWILGILDNYIPYSAVLEKVALPPDAEFVLLENSGHMGFVEEAERSAEIMDQFIRRVRLSQEPRLI